MATPPQSPLAAELRRASRVLANLRVRWALVGGLAVSARTEPRFTADVDAALLAADDAAAEKVVHGLVRRGYVVTAAVEEKRAGRLATARLRFGGPGAAAALDVLFASSGIEPEIVAAAEILEVLPGVRLPVATIGHLIALKLLSRGRARPQDDADLAALAAEATRGDWSQARAAVELINERGSNRGRHLGRALSRWSRR